MLKYDPTFYFIELSDYMFFMNAWLCDDLLGLIHHEDCDKTRFHKTCLNVLKKAFENTLKYEVFFHNEQQQW